MTEATANPLDQMGGGSAASAGLVNPAANLGLLSVFKSTYLLRLLVRREIAARYSDSLLGLAWSYINPGVQFLVYWLIVGNILDAHSSTPNYPVHILAALMLTHFFTETFAAGTRSIVINKALVVRMPIPKEMFPVAATVVSLVHVVPELILLSLLSGYKGWARHGNWMSIVWILLALAITLVLGTAVALLFSVADVYFRDFGSVVGILTFVIRFAVPMMYPFARVADAMGDKIWIYLLNPVATAILCVERGFWYPTIDHGALTPREHASLKIEFPAHLLWISCFTLLACCVLLVVAQYVFNKFEKKIPERL